MKLKIPIKYKVWFNQMPLSILRNQDGVTAVLVAIVAAMLLGFTALAIDVGYMYSTRNELQNVADAAALAGAGELGRIYLELDPGEQPGLTVAECQDEIRAAVQDVAVLNQAAGEPISIYCPVDNDTDCEIYIGIWAWDSTDPSTALDYTTEFEPPDAVRVIARRSETANSAVTTFFGKIFSFFGGSADTFEAYAVATAALSGAGNIEEGILKTPFAISENNLCGDQIVFSPTNSCAGWHNYLDSPATAVDIEDKMYGFIKDHKGASGTEGADWLDDWANVSATALTAPELSYGEDINLSGGNISSLFNGFYYSKWIRDDNGIPIPDETFLENGPVTPGTTYAPFIALFDFFKFRDEDGEVIDGVANQVNVVCDPLPTGITSPMPADEVWTTTIPVYKDTEPFPGCSNPTGAMEVIGFANVQVLRPDPTSNNSITACMTCYDVIEPGRGSGVTAGNVRGNIPSLVE